MNEGSSIYLAVMAVALVVMAGIQVGLIVVVLRVTKQLTATAEEIRREVMPLVAKRIEFLMTQRVSHRSRSYKSSASIGCWR